MALSLLIPRSIIAASGHQNRGIGPWRQRLWEWHTGLLGLALSFAGAFFTVSGLKDIVGKPRPDFLARCNPDLSNISTHLAGGLGMRREGAAVLVYSSICQNRDAAVVKDGFAAFLSGHSSFASTSTSLERRSSRLAAPPLYLLFVAVSPVGLAFCICATPTRTTCMPVGGGWAFPARSRSQAFWVPYGSPGYTEDVNVNGYEDLEMGPVHRR
ncbi:hypothetical protein BJX62DRAFT_224574 [Aspergillus germanicus]